MANSPTTKLFPAQNYEPIFREIERATAMNDTTILKTALRDLLDADRDFLGQDNLCVYCGSIQPDHAPDCVITQARNALKEETNDADTTGRIPAHPLVMDSVTKLYRLATQNDILEFELIASKYEHLRRMLKEAINDEPF